LLFPPSACDVFGYPIDQVTEIAVRETLITLKANPSLESVYFACFGEEVFEAYAARLGEIS
jgi:O-acetyl-ADP-ribose deacetylase (regulator of RNase III)